MADTKLKRMLLEVVDNQLRDGEPACVKEALAELEMLRCTSSKAREILAIAISDEIFAVMKNQEEYDRDRYETRVRDLVDRYERGLPYYDE